MALEIRDRVKETCTGTNGDMTLTGAVSGFVGFDLDDTLDGDTIYYALEDADGTKWEVGLGTLSADSTTLARTTILATQVSFTDTTRQTFSGGTHTIFATYPASKAVYLDASGNLSHTVDLTSEVTGTLPVGNGGTGLTSIATLLNSNVTPTSLGLVIGTNVQAYDAQLATLAGLTVNQVAGLVDLATLEAPASDGQFVVATGAGAFAYESGATARTSLGLGDIATQDHDSIDIDGGNIDGATIATSDITVGSSKTLDVSAGTLTTSAAQNLAIVQGAASNIDIGAYELRAQTLESDVSTGTAPLTVSSTTKVANLNADKLDDQEGSYYLDFGNFVIDDDEIPIAKLASDSINFGGVTLALGGSDTTPAFDLSHATNYPTSSLSGTITNAQLAGSIANAKLANSSITVAVGSDSTAISLGGTMTFAGTANEVEVSESSGTVTIGLPNNVTIAGNLTVNGTTTTVDSTTLSVADPLIILASGNNAADSVDIGFYGLYDTSGSQDLYAGLFRDANDSGKFKLFKD